MELRIISPQESGFVKEICWNNEELKKEISAKMKDYKGLVFTDETIREAKKDRADLNKLRSAFEDERKRIKKLCMEPYNCFEKQVKEVIALIEEPIRLIDMQIKEVDERKKEQKRKDIEELFASVGFQNFVTLNQIFDSKWLNASVSLNSIREQMENRKYQIGNDILSINNLPEFSFEALEIYKSTLNIGQAIQEGRRLSEVQKRKAAYEEEQKKRAEEERTRKEAETRKTCEQREEIFEVSKASGEQIQTDVGEKITIDFRVVATSEQLEALKRFLIENKITYGRVPKKGE